MEKNVGGNDRLYRFIVGAVLAVVGVAGYAGVLRVAVGPLPQALTSLVLVLLGLVLVGTGLARWCPINKALGRDTCPA